MKSADTPDNLNKSQEPDPYRTAVETLDRDVLVVANAGSGKTHLLVEHYFFLLSQGFQPNQISAFTFTEKAAVELKERIISGFRTHRSFQGMSKDILAEWKTKILGAPIGTIHQFCLRVLRDQPDPLKDLPWEILDEAGNRYLEEWNLEEFLWDELSNSNSEIHSLLQQYGIQHLKENLKAFLKRPLYHEIQRNDENIPDFLSQEKNNFLKFLALSAQLGRRITENKKAELLVSFEDLELQALEKIKILASSRKGFWKQIKHILVDEYQDTSPIQINIIDELRIKGSNPGNAPLLYCVGDPKQSIYRFRHVDRLLLEQTSQKILKKGGKKFDFTNNYRSTEAILTLVNEFASQAFPESLPSQSQRGLGIETQVQIIDLQDSQEKINSEEGRARSAAWVTQQIMKTRERGISLSEMAVLFRASASALPLIDQLKSAGIPFTLRGGRNLLNQQGCLDLKNLLFFISHPVNDIPLIGVLRSPLFLISDETLYHLSLILRKKAPLWDQLISISKKEIESLPGDGKKLAWAIASLQDLVLRAKILTPYALFRELFQKWDLPSLYLKATQDFDSTLAIEQFLEWLKNEKATEVVPLLKKLKRTSTTIPPLGDLIEHKDSLSLLTIHASKGLQFDTVFILDLGRSPPANTAQVLFLGDNGALKLPQENGDWLETPRFKNLKEFHGMEDWEENKRLLYVAMTRAKNALYIPINGKKSRGNSLKKALLECVPEEMIKSSPLNVTSRKKIHQNAGGSTKIQDALLPSRSILTQTPWTTVSELETFNLCPMKHHFAYREKLSDKKWHPKPEMVDQTEMGTILHRAIHEVSLRPDHDLGKILQSLWNTLPHWKNEKLFVELQELLESYCRSPLWKMIFEADEDYPELPFLLNLKHGHLRGQIDRLIRKGSDWFLIDFKFTTKPASKDVFHRAFGFQLKTYALAVQKILKGIIPQVRIHSLSNQKDYIFNFTAQDLNAQGALVEKLTKNLYEPNLKDVSFRDACHTCPYHHFVPVCPIPKVVASRGDN